MKTSESILKIAPDVIAAHAKMTEIERNATNPFTESEYADLEAVLSVIRPILAAHNLALMQFPSFSGGQVGVVSRLLHISGEWFEEEASAGSLPPDPQKAGSAITYLRRYSAMAICGIAPKDDDAAPGKNKKKKGQATQTATQASSGEKSMWNTVKAFPPDVKALLTQAKIFTAADQYKAYQQGDGDMDTLKQLLNEKIRALKK